VSGAGNWEPGFQPEPKTKMGVVGETLVDCGATWGWGTSHSGENKGPGKRLVTRRGIATRDDKKKNEKKQPSRRGVAQ